MLLVWIVAFKAALDCSYYYYLSPLFDYAGMTLAVEPLKYVESWLATVGFALLLRERIERPSDFFMLILVMLSAIPVFSLYGLRGDSRSAFYLIVLSLIAVRAMISASRFTLSSTPLPGGVDIATRTALALTAIEFLWLIANGALGNMSFDLDAVYSLRSEAEAVQDVGPFAYLGFWIPNVALPFLLARALHHRAFWQVLAYCALEILLFAMTTHKRVLFYPLLVVLLYVVAREGFRAHRFVLLFTTMIAATMGMLAWSSDWLMPISLLVRRALFVPADLVFGHYDVFSRLGQVWMSNTIFGVMVSYPFTIDPPMLVGSQWLGNDTTWANAGFLGTGYMHFGSIGAIAFGAIVGMIFKSLDALAIDLPLWFALSVAAAPMISMLTSADLPTSLLTHGIVPAMWVLWLCARAALAHATREETAAPAPSQS